MGSSSIYQKGRKGEANSSVHQERGAISEWGKENGEGKIFLKRGGKRGMAFKGKQRRPAGRGRKEKRRRKNGIGGGGLNSKSLEKRRQSLRLKKGGGKGQSH